MTTLKERFNAKFPLADYEAVYTRLIRDNKEDYEMARNLEKTGIPHYPFSYIEEVGKEYLGSEVKVGFLVELNHDLNIGFDMEKDLFYAYKPNFIFLYRTLNEYVEGLIEHMIA